MATNGANNVEDSEMAECDGEKVVTMMDVLQEEQDFEDDANAVLGASDEKNCTYSKGYIKRQAIYACLTCCNEAKYDPTKRAGVCLACSLNCHENHELVELYTKRNFRCDCGNPKFNSHPCQFTPDKNDLNDENNYNQNFSGLYCNCHRPYPDPDATIEDEEMIQCIICEDWLHASHLDAIVPGNDQYSEMVCKACMEKNEFLHDYSGLAVNVETGDVDVITVNVNGTEPKITNGDLETEILMNGSEESSKDTAEEPKTEMEVDKEQTENKSAIENETTENQESEKPEEDKPSSEPKDVTEKTEEQSQKVANSDAKEDINMVVNSEEELKKTEETLESQDSENKDSDILEESSESPSETPESSKAVAELSQDPEDTKETEEKTVGDIPDTEKTEEISDKNAENIEPTVDKDQITENVGLTEEKSDIPENISDNDKVDEMAKLDSETSDAKQEENIQTTNENDVMADDIKTSSAENETKLDSADTEMKEVNKDEALEKTNETEKDDINKPDNTQADEPINNATSEPEINDSVSKEESNEIPQDMNTEEPVEKAEVPNETAITEENKENKRKLSTEDLVDDNLTKKPKLDNDNTCSRPKGVKRVHKGATFWPSSFRQKLCTCSECLSMYKDLSVLYLIDPEDTVFAYETLGKERVDGRATQYEKGLEALSSLDRIQQINALTEYNKMKDKLLDFLKSFKDRKEVVKEEDIKSFFAGMKPKREPDGVYFCR